MNWNTPDAPDQYAALVRSRAQVQAAICADRRRDALSLWRLRGALLAIVFAVIVLLVGLIDSPADHVGPDEMAHVRAGRQVVEVTR
ncbi:hypothetical protein [Armatimonas rosea]|uniref:Uncharacterized protein n=1 Tax=Armatimonas rosea TaxID=685828 RepID=A0A7W9SV97_ARMRO|nr:hypothetical protein [Armatimonas rosea]MBB6053316.1 hypothetical protein [Armatimonas rosea]